jgi:hypothetical protein
MDLGDVQICKEESGIVKRVFDDYINGNSLTAIAKALTAEGLRFHPDKAAWNKHMVKRILEDERYLGADAYPEIISESAYNEARSTCNTRRAKNNAGGDKDTLRLPCTVVCEKCGSKMEHIHDKRRSDHTYWRCRHSDCRTRIIISDEDMKRRLISILNHIICHTDVIGAPDAAGTASKEQPVLTESERSSNGVAKMLDSIDIDKERLKEKIFACAYERYKELDDKVIVSELMKADLGKRDPLLNLDKELLERNVKGIVLSENGTLNLLLKNGQVIRGNEQNERNEYAGKFFAKEYKADTA